MSYCETLSAAQRRGARPFVLAALAVTILTSGCAGTTIGGDAGCEGYAEARLAMPDEPLPPGAWGGWAADLDDRMTAICT